MPKGPKTVEGQFKATKTGKWSDRTEPMPAGGGFSLGRFVLVRCTGTTPAEVRLELGTLKHVELEGGTALEPDPPQPSGATDLWWRRRVLTPGDSYLRIGDGIFLRVEFGEAASCTFRTRRMAAVMVEPLPPAADAGKVA